MTRLANATPPLLIVSIALLSFPMNTYAWEPNADDLDAAIKAGDFTAYFTDISTWLNQKAPADSSKTTEAGMKALLNDPVVANTLDQRQLISKHGVDNIGAFARADQGNKTFLAWLLRNTQAMDLYLVGATPTGLERRELDRYTLDTASLALWRKLFDADPDSKEGIYLKLAIATAISPPPAMSYVGAGGIGAVPIDPVERYNHFKSAHKNNELFPIFDTLTVWEYRKVVADWASDGELSWVREMVNTWRPDLRKDQQVHTIVSEVWRRDSPFFYTKGFVTVMEGGGKCGPRSWFGTMTCRAFGIPTVGVGQPGHAAFGIKSADPSSEPQPGSVWKVVYGRAWHVSKCEGVSGPEFLSEAEARSREIEFSQGEHLRWLASTWASSEQADAVMAVARKIQQSASGAESGRSVAMPATPSIAEPPFKAVPGVMHVEAESFANMSGVFVYDCFTGGKQVNFQKNMESSWIDYTVDVPAAGTYGLTMRVATPNREQVLDVGVDTNQLATVDIPNTTGLWGTTEEVELRLKEGTRTLRFSAPYQRGIAVRWFELNSKGVNR